MDKTYIKLFTELAHTTELLSEQVMELNKQKNDERGLKTANTMRQDYSKLYDKLRDANFDYTTLERNEFAKLLVGAIITAQQIENRIKAEQTALNGYKIDIIPKLERVVNETEDTPGALALAKEIFTVEKENN